ncbi:DoxX family membrane protein [Panacibacter ginsenosidivorans]|uniref:DoxX family membrane protein n=1 Tax=Panacibacter ginsenosidivorans TaxID=1813871 RepID=A0A5B8VBJ4_9BACT|nr:DoxX family membrane protein [Panacibacter ginsenosidivorans]QEC68373.1 DoxX family membrane protein [Panacibacter ginsenosidivorans]
MQTKVLSAANKNFYSSLSVLRVSVGIVYLWFGALKFFQGVSPAEQLAAETIHRITFGLINDHTNLMMLATWECMIGVMLIIGKFIKPVLVLLFLHMICTFTPFIFFPEETFRHVPYGLTLTGQYIIKNIVFIAVAVVLWNAEQGKYAINEQ